MKKQIVITFDELGKATVETVGFKGKACEDATRAIEAALGEVESKTKTPDYYKTPDVSTHQTT